MRQRQGGRWEEAHDPPSQRSAAAAGFLRLQGKHLRCQHVRAPDRRVIWTNSGTTTVTVSLTVRSYVEGPGSGIPVKGNYEIG
ncbi:hypothetical protein GCM10022247_73120 [Allokutzneria multivorans]|uniref:Uncharacterized protein n=1 Tax=Allokutzneria multivorans TaxID=1142134 RepID=A0ABP7U6I5_9PSEU